MVDGDEIVEVDGIDVGDNVDGNDDDDVDDGLSAI